MKKEIILQEHKEAAKRSLYLANSFIEGNKEKEEIKFVADGYHYAMSFRNFESKNTYFIETTLQGKPIYRKYFQSPKQLVESIEELFNEEVKSGATLIHYTTIDGLLGILRDGRIKGSRLLPGGFIAQTLTNDPSEIAFTRRSHDRDTRNKERGINPSTKASRNASVEEIRIYVNKEEVLKRVRYAKAGKISEMGKLIADSDKRSKYLFDIENKFYKSSTGKEKLTKEEIQKARKLFKILMDKIYGFLKKVEGVDFIDEVPSEDLNKFIKEVYNIKDENISGGLVSFLSRYLFLKSSNDFNAEYIRTGEERIYFKKAPDKDLTGVPVDRKFMRIRILQNATRSNEKNKELYELIMKNQNVFLKDKYFKEFTEGLIK